MVSITFGQIEHYLFHRARAVVFSYFFCVKTTGSVEELLNNERGMRIWPTTHRPIWVLIKSVGRSVFEKYGGLE